MQIPKITEVTIRLVEGLPRLKAYADITVENSLLIKDVKVIKTAEKYHAAFPQRSKQSPELIVLLNSDTRKYFEGVIANAYISVKNKNINEEC